jgi:hypothetical protein
VADERDSVDGAAQTYYSASPQAPRKTIGPYTAGGSAGWEDEDEMDGGTESDDSDFGHGAAPAASTAALMRGHMRVAKLYGYESSPPPGFAVEFELRWVELHADAVWHADEYDAATCSMLGDVGMLELERIDSCSLSASGNELVLSQSGKCHLLARHELSTTGLHEWFGAVAAELKRMDGDEEPHSPDDFHARDDLNDRASM